MVDHLGVTTISLAAVQHYVKDALDGMGWPFGGVENLVCYIQPPNPNVQAEIPVAYVWMQRDRESRDTDKLRSGTIPRVEFPGGPSGTKAVDYRIPIWVTWDLDISDPDIENLFPGVVWQVRSVLRGGAYAANGSFVRTPALLTDPWTGEQSWLIDLGEEMSTETYERALNPQSTLLRFDAVIECSVSEVIAA